MIFHYLVFSFICFSQAAADHYHLQVKKIREGLQCIIDSNHEESAHSFLLQGDEGSILIDAGWSNQAVIPIEISRAIAQSKKVATHFHFDHIQQWHSMENIILTKQQASLCKDDLCSPTIWQTIVRVSPFKFIEETIDKFTANSVNGRLSFIPCKGHSKTDACYLDEKSRTLFVGDLFYLGPVFYFLPRGNVDLAIESLELLLKRNDWDQLALSHGECSTNRSKLLEFVDDLKRISIGEITWSINFDFWLPLRAYKTHSGFVVTNLFW